MKLPLSVSDESKEPIYHQIEHQLKTMIVSGQLPAGTLLPSIRALSSDLACSVITTRRAYQNLENDGFIKTIQGKGTYVKEISAHVQEETKRKIVHAALVKAVEQAELIGCSMDEIRSIFDDIARER